MIEKKQEKKSQFQDCILNFATDGYIHVIFSLTLKDLGSNIVWYIIDYTYTFMKLWEPF